MSVYRKVYRCLPSPGLGSLQSLHGVYKSVQNYNCTFNPFDKWAEAMEENKKLYEALLESERKRIALLEKLLEEKK
ncbi:MAG: hypothetical protein MI921_28645 [Cytophagales bacterium]|nr:hypothetical protein [Cytophagales bacterium]